MSEQTKLLFLEQEIKQAQKHERNGEIFTCLGIVIAVTGLLLYGTSLIGWQVLVNVGMGIIIILLGIFESVTYHNRVKRLMIEARAFYSQS